MKKKSGRGITFEFLEGRTLLSTYYVSPSGSDSGAGTSTGAAWKTLQKAANSVVAGDIVHVLAGTYTAGMNLVDRSGGTAAKPISFIADPGAKITHATTSGTNAGFAGINIENAGGYYVIQGFTIQSDGSMQKAGIRVTGSDGTQVLDCTVVSAYIGIFSTNSSNLLIQNNICHDSSGQHDIYLSDGCVDCTVRGNTLYNNAWDGFHTNGQVGPNDNNLIEDNVIYGNHLSGMDLEGTTNSTFRNNLIYNNAKHGITLHNADEDPIAPPTIGNTFVNNTIYGNGNFAIQMLAGNTANTVYNNILFGGSSYYGSIGTAGAPSGLKSDYNIVGDSFMTTVYGSESAISLASWRSQTGQDQHSIISSATSVFVSTSDLHLKSGSPAVDAGVTSFNGKSAPTGDLEGNLRPQGNGIDIGAMERASGVTPDTTPPTVSSVLANSITTSSATITWTTNESATTQAEYGLSTSYGSSTTLVATLVTSHSAAISGLAAGTVIHYRVKSTDAAGNTTTSGDFTFTTSTPDTTPPTVSSVASGTPTTSAATITWTTNEAGTTQVEYGTTTSYGTSSTLNNSLVTSHSVALSGLAASTTYHYRVKSTDAAGNTIVSGDFTFTTAAPADTTPPVVSNIVAGSITTSGAIISWTTNEASDTQVQYGTTTSYGSTTMLNSTKVTSHSVTLSGLAASTTYHFRVKSRDAAGNLTTSGDFTFTTSAAADVTPPTVSSISSGTPTSSGATITWNTNEASTTQVEYGTSGSYGSSSTQNNSLVTSHSSALSGLAASTTYHYRVKSTDAAGNTNVSSDFTFTTAAPPDATPPVVSGIVTSNLTTTGATIAWTTNEAADTQVQYGTTTGYGSSSTLNASQVTSHSVTLSALAASTTYHFRVKSRDAAGNLTTSGDFTFTTAAPADVTPPTITSVLAGNVTVDGATITWNTNETSDTQVQYGTTNAYGSTTALGTTLVTSHLAFITDLAPNTTYHFRVMSRDGANNLRTSGDYTFTTAAAPDTTPPLITVITAQNATESAVTITWNTDEPADSLVEYGPDANYGSSSTLNVAKVTDHSVTLTGLNAQTTYHFRVTSTDAAGNVSVSGDDAFTTLAPSDTTAPTAQLSAENITSGETGYTFDVVYDDDVELDSDTINLGDVRVNGPNGFSSLSHFVSLAGTGGHIVATYSLDAPSDAWTAADNGTYTIVMANSEVTDTSNNAVAPAALGTFTVNVPPPDLAGNTMATARMIGQVTPPRVRVAEDYVGPGDLDDYHQITIGSAAKLDLKLYNLSDNADLELLDGSGNRIAFAQHDGASSESLSVGVGAGTYYLHVISAGEIGTNYRLRVETSVPSVGGTDPFAGARNLGKMNHGMIRAVVGNVGTTGRNDLYSFSATESIQLTTKLYNMTDDADLMILDASGNRIAYSKRTGTTREVLTLDLAPGTYFARVMFTKGATSGTPYRLRLGAA